MDIIDLGNPEPRTPPALFDEFVFPVSNTTYLPVPSANKNVGFFDTIQARATNREFAKINNEQLSHLLWHTSKIKSTKKLDAGHVWQHRPTPSAGGRHSIDILIISSHDKKLKIQVYDPIAHALGNIESLEMSAINQLHGFLTDNFEPGEATIIWFAAQFKKMTSAYRNATSLIYRDTGALEATIGLTAEALGLNHCSIGITGEPWISDFLNSADYIRGVGGMLIGESSINNRK